jgi:predicted phosphodiesterase
MMFEIFFYIILMLKKSRLLFYAFAIFAMACSDTYESKPEMLGITPGSDISELNFAWYSDEGGKAFVSVFNESGEVVATGKGISGAASKGKFFHKASVNGLSPNTKYKYFISNDSANWSDGYGYKTPKTDAFKFAAIGDPQIGGDLSTDLDDDGIEEWRKTVAKIAAHNADFIASAGDHVDNGEDETEYASFFAPPELRNIPFAPALGNHDMNNDSKLFIYHFNLPNSPGGSLKEYANYWYLYNNVLFVALNTAPWPNSREEAESSVQRFDAALSAAKKANAGKYDWIIVKHHRSTRSVARHSAGDDIKRYKEAGFEDLMEKHGVDIVLAGHDHVYARSRPINGVIYITLNSSSGSKYYDPIIDSAGLAENQIEKHFQNRKPSYAIFSVIGKTISAEFYDIYSDASADRFEAKK